MVKKWSEKCSVKVKSYKIENEVLAFFVNNANYNSYSSLVKDFFEFFHNNATDKNLKSHLSTAFNRAKKACDFEENDDLEKAVEEWKKVFGDNFPKIETQKNITESCPRPIVNPPKPWLSN